MVRCGAKLNLGMEDESVPKGLLLDFLGAIFWKHQVKAPLPMEAG